MKPIKVKQVLAAVDFSDWTVPVLNTAAELAEKYGAKLTVVHTEMVFPPAYFSEYALDQIRYTTKQQVKETENHLKRTVREAIGDQVTWETRVICAVPAEGIMRTAGQIGADMIVLGTHGRTGFSRLLLGSVAERVFREAKVPVLTVHRENHGTKTGSLPFKKILCPVNYTKAARTSMAYAVDMAQKFGSELIVMNILEDGVDSSKEMKQAEQNLLAWVPEEIRASCNIRPLVRCGCAAEQILTEVGEEPYDMIVIAAQHRALLETTIFGTTSVRVMRHAPCPVLAVVQGVGPDLDTTA